MRIKLPQRYIFNPASFVLVMALLSALAWSVPSFGVLRKGYAVRAEPTFMAFLVLSTWYLCISFSFFIGQKFGTIGSKLIKIDRELFDLDRPRYLYLFTFITAVGLAITYYKILTGLTLAKAFFFVTNHQANMLKETLYEEYSAGVMSLRYLIVFSAPLAFRRFLKYRKMSFIVVANVFLLIFVGVLSARLLVVASILNLIFISSYYKTHFEVKLLKPLIVVLVFFSVMSVFNFTRNADYYDQRGLSFWGAGISEILTYLGSPFQVSVGAANTLSKALNVQSETYRSYVSIEDDLNTNSSFVFLHEEMGFLAWPYIVGLTLALGCLFRFFVGYGRTIFMLPAGAILYGSAELWRLDLYRQGIFVTWFVCSVSVPFLANIFHFFGKLIVTRRAKPLAADDLVANQT